MRIRLAVPLPGPFVLTRGRHRRSSSGGWLVAVLLVLVIVGACFAHPWLMVPFAAVLALVVVAGAREARRRR